MRLPWISVVGWVGIIGWMGIASACGTDAAIPDAGSRPRDGGPPPDDSPYKGPWSLQPSTTSILVRWESQLRPAIVELEVSPEGSSAMTTHTGTSRETTVRLSYGIGTTAVREPDVPGTYYVNEVQVSGLEPATCYTYRLVGWPDHGGRFCTMHAPDDHTTPIRLYVIGDTSPAVMGTLRVLSSADPREAEVTLHAGDIQYYSTVIESHQLWFRLMQPLLEASAFMPCVGNHEMDEGGLPEYADIYQRLFSPAGGEADGNNDRYYHFESGGVHFFSLSTEHDIEVGSEQIDWLEARLTAIEADPNYRFSVVYLHRPLYSLGDYVPRDSNRESLFPVFAAHRVRLVLAGHTHAFEHFEVGDITYITSGAGGFVDTTIDQQVDDRPAEAALRVFSGLFLQAMFIEIAQDAMGRDVIRGRVVDDMGIVRHTFDRVLMP